MTSRHWREDRIGRNALIELIGEGEKVDSFRVERGHRNGAEIHTITTNAIIIITNERTGKMITKLIARPGQIRKYYEDGNAPQEILRQARRNFEKGYNEM